MAEVKIDIKVDDKSVGQSVEKVESLRQQIRKLQQDISKEKVGSKEFNDLSEQLKDAKDQMDLVNAKSGDLFDSFNRLPGPIGMIGTAVQGTLDDLKILSSFSFKDVGKQFAAIGDDISLIGSNLAKTTGITAAFNKVTLLTSNALKAVGISANVSSKGLKLFSAALVATGIGAVVLVLGLLIANFDKLKNALFNLIPGLKSVTDFVGGLVNKFTDLIGITNEAERAEKKRQETYDKAKKGTDIVNDAIQREINLLKARGATQEEIDKKRKEIIQNELNDLKKLADGKGKLYGEDAKKYKDLQNQLAVIDAEAETRKAEETKKNNEKAKAAADKKAADDKAKADKKAQEQKAFLEAQADAVVQIEKDKEDTNAETLRKALERQNELRNEGKRISAEVAQAQAAEIEKIVQDEVNKDIETRKKAFDDRVNQVKSINKLIIDEVTSNAELQKLTYGENSKEARAAVDEVFNAQLKALEDEKGLLNTKKELTNEDKLRLREIAVEETNLTNQKILENKKRLQSDFEAFLKSEEQAKNNQIARIEREMEQAGMDTERLQNLLNEKIRIEEEYYARLLANESLTAEQRAEIQKQQTESVKANAEAQIQIEEKRFNAQQQLLSATSSALATFADQLGKDTAAGKALAVAASLINTYAAIAGQLKAASVSPGAIIPGYAIAQAVATGVVGFKAVRDIIATPVPNGGGSAPLQPRRLASGGVVESNNTTNNTTKNYQSLSNKEFIKEFITNNSSVVSKFAEGGIVEKNNISNSNTTSNTNNRSSVINKFADGGIVENTNNNSSNNTSNNNNESNKNISSVINKFANGGIIEETNNSSVINKFANGGIIEETNNSSVINKFADGGIVQQTSNSNTSNNNNESNKNISSVINKFANGGIVQQTSNNTSSDNSSSSTIDILNEYINSSSINRTELANGGIAQEINTSNTSSKSNTSNRSDNSKRSSSIIEILNNYMNTTQLATGGMVRGPGGEKSDLIPAMLSNGESVINAKSTRLFRPLLSSINELGGGKKFADGGLAISPFNQDQALSNLTQQLTPSSQPIKTYVVANDMTNQQMFDRMAKNRSTL